MTMLTVREIAEDLGVCKMTVYRLIHGGQLDALKVGESYRIEEKDYQAYRRKVKVRGNASGAAGS